MSKLLNYVLAEISKNLFILATETSCWNFFN